MSKYLCVGLAKEIVAVVRDEKMAKEVELDFFKKFDKDIYDVRYDAKADERRLYVFFNLKEDLMAKYAMDLMIEQHEKFIKSKFSEGAIKYYKDIKSKSKEEIIHLINTENKEELFTFRIGRYIFNISFLFDVRVKAYITEFTTFHCSQKTYMEEYSEFFKYMRNILLNSTDNPLRTALVVSLWLLIIIREAKFEK